MLLRVAACNCKYQGIHEGDCFYSREEKLPALSHTSHLGQSTDYGVQISTALALFASLALLCCTYAMEAHKQGPWSEAGLQTPPHLQMELEYILFQSSDWHKVQIPL